MPWSKCLDFFCVGFLMNSKLVSVDIKKNCHGFFVYFLTTLIYLKPSLKPLWYVHFSKIILWVNFKVLLYYSLNSVIPAQLYDSFPILHINCPLRGSLQYLFLLAYRRFSWMVNMISLFLYITDPVSFAHILHDISIPNGQRLLYPNLPSHRVGMLVPRAQQR